MRALSVRGFRLRLAQAFGAGLGWIWYALLPIRRSVARRNVAAALGLPPVEVEAVVRAMYLNLGRSAAELLCLASAVEATEVEGEEHLRAALAGGRGVLLLSAHLGNWEVLVRAAMRTGAPTHVVTKRLHSAWAERLWRRARRGGAKLLFERHAGRAIVRALAAGEIVAFVLDQHAPEPSALRLPFLGRPAATSTGLARLALKSGAPVVPIFTHRRPDGTHAIRIGPALSVQGDVDEPVEALTRACLAEVEAAVRAHPEQWLWIHRRWKP